LLQQEIIISAAIIGLFTLRHRNCSTHLRAVADC
jgi:hypothetical protein